MAGKREEDGDVSEVGGAVLGVTVGSCWGGGRMAGTSIGDLFCHLNGWC